MPVNPRAVIPRIDHLVAYRAFKLLRNVLLPLVESLLIRDSPVHVFGLALDRVVVLLDAVGIGKDLQGLLDGCRSWVQTLVFGTGI